MRLQRSRKANAPRGADRDLQFTEATTGANRNVSTVSYDGVAA